MARTILKYLSTLLVLIAIPVMASATTDDIDRSKIPVAAPEYPAATEIDASALILGGFLATRDDIGMKLVDHKAALFLALDDFCMPQNPQVVRNLDDFLT